MKFTEYSVLEAFLCLVFNGDDSGLEPDEVKEWSEFEDLAVKDAGSPANWHWSTKPSEYDEDEDERDEFAECDATGMMGSCATLVLVNMDEVMAREKRNARRRKSTIPA